MGKKKNRVQIAPVIIGAIMALCCMIPVTENLFGKTGYVTEIRYAQRQGGALADGSRPNTYEWTVGYTFKTQSGEYVTGSVTVNGDAISSKSKLKAGDPVRYLAFAPNFNTPGNGMLDGGVFWYLLPAGFGVFMIVLGIRSGKPREKRPRRKGISANISKRGTNHVL